MKMSEETVREAIEEAEDIIEHYDGLPTEWPRLPCDAGQLIALCQDWLAMREALDGLVRPKTGRRDYEYESHLSCFVCRFCGHEADNVNPGDKCWDSDCPANKARRLLEGEK